MPGASVAEVARRKENHHNAKEIDSTREPGTHHVIHNQTSCRYWAEDPKQTDPKAGSATCGLNRSGTGTRFLNETDTGVRLLSELRLVRLQSDCPVYVLLIQWQNLRLLPGR